MREMLSIVCLLALCVVSSLALCVVVVGTMVWLMGAM